MTLPEVVVVIVGFKNTEDVLGCLRALSQADPHPRFDIIIAENGGSDSAAALRARLAEPGGPCTQVVPEQASQHPLSGLGGTVFRLPRTDGGSDSHVHLLDMPENLGYAGGINACLRPLLQIPGWNAIWILNPDTQPTPSALFELADYAAKRGKSMVGSRITTDASDDVVVLRGLRWQRFLARTTAVDYHAPASIEPDPAAVDAKLDSPSGASMYVTRELIERIGLMDERYFLYFEDLHWGYRARAFDAIGYAHRSVVPHRGGTTIGTDGTRAGQSRLSVYLEFRNRILFVRELHRNWLPWTILMQAAHVATFLAAGSFANTFTASSGILAGLKGEVGRPDRILAAHNTR